MADINLVVIEGNLTRAAEKKSHNGKDFYVMTIASDEFKTNSGKKTNFFDLEWWTPNGAAQYLEKGKGVIVQGKISQNKWVDSDGNNRSKIIIKVEKLELRGGTKQKNDSDSTESSENAESLEDNEFLEDKEDFLESINAKE